MTTTSEQTLAKQVDRTRTIRELRELIAALDRRIPRVERVREISIAHAAAELKSEALQRIEELGQETARMAISDRDAVTSTML